MTKRRHRTPTFVRQESWRLVRVKEHWRRPRGKTSKMRLGLRGWPKAVKIGYRSARKTRGLHPSGLQEVTVRRPEDLDRIDPKTQIVKISGSIGERKRIAIMERVQTLQLTVTNPGPKKTEAGPAEELIVKEPESSGSGAVGNTEGDRKE